MATFDQSQNIQAILNSGRNVSDLGALIGRPLLQAANRRGTIQRQDQQVEEQRQIEAQKNELRDDTAEALALFQQPPELRRQALSARLVQAQQEGDQEEVQAVGNLMNMDDVGIEDTLKSAIFRGSELLPPGLLQSAGLGRVASTKSIGGKDNFVKQVGTDDAGQPIFQNFSATLARDAQGGISSEETAFGPQFTQDQGNPLISSKIEQAGRAAGAAAQAKADVEAKATPRLRSSIARATKRANAAADDEEKLKALNANLPIVNDMADKLRALSSDATHTLTGRAFNFFAKESGFGATKGSTARAKYQAIIDNQVLPLLKATFGAAFTEAEGRRLAATLGDVDAAPAEKMAQLDAFLDSQQSQIQALERKAAPARDPAAANVAELSDEDLFK